jgi:hypothetical protein
MNEQYYGNFLSRPIRFLVHKIVLQFCVFPINLPPVLLLFSHKLLLVCIAQPCHGRDSIRYLCSTWEPVISLLFGDLLYQMAAPWNNLC